MGQKQKIVDSDEKNERIEKKRENRKKEKRTI